MSSLLRQVALLAAGCQPWHKDVCAANGDRFAYCATLAVYIYEVSTDQLKQATGRPCIFKQLVAGTVPAFTASCLCFAYRRKGDLCVHASSKKLFAFEKTPVVWSRACSTPAFSCCGSEYAWIQARRVDRKCSRLLESAA